MSLESFNIDICCLSKTRMQNSSVVPQIRSPSLASNCLFHVHLSGYHMKYLSGIVDFGIALRVKAEAAPIDWIVVNS